MNTVICVELNHSQVEHNQICSNYDPRTTLPFCCEKYPTQYDAVQSFINGVFFNYRNILTIFGTLYKSSDFLYVNYWIINMIKHLLVWELRHFDLYPSLYMFFAHKAYCRLITTVTWRAISQVSTRKKYNFSFICFTYKTLYFFIQLLNLILLVLYA